jgi:hypothetical protein
MIVILIVVGASACFLAASVLDSILTMGQQVSRTSSAESGDNSTLVLIDERGRKYYEQPIEHYEDTHTYFRPDAYSTNVQVANGSHLFAAVENSTHIHEYNLQVLDSPESISIAQNNSQPRTTENGVVHVNDFVRDDATEFMIYSHTHYPDSQEFTLSITVLHDNAQATYQFHCILSPN